MEDNLYVYYCRLSVLVRWTHRQQRFKQDGIKSTRPSSRELFTNHRPGTFWWLSKHTCSPHLYHRPTWLYMALKNRRLDVLSDVEGNKPIFRAFIAQQTAFKPPCKLTAIFPRQIPALSYQQQNPSLCLLRRYAAGWQGIKSRGRQNNNTRGCRKGFLVRQTKRTQLRTKNWLGDHTGYSRLCNTRSL